MESLTLSPGPQPHSDGLSSSLQATTAGHFPCDHLRGGGWVPETQTELTEFQSWQAWGWSTLRCPPLLCSVGKALGEKQDQRSGEESKLGEVLGPSWPRFLYPCVNVHLLCWLVWEKVLCAVSVYTR